MTSRKELKYLKNGKNDDILIKLICTYAICYHGINISGGSRGGSGGLEGAQWLSGRVLDSRPKGRGFELHHHHCLVSLSKTY